jgi:hypothetical protein
MACRNGIFGCLIKPGIARIAYLEGAVVADIESELGEQIGVMATMNYRCETSRLPRDLRTVRILI